MNRPPIRIGISTCPNDTFAFAPLLTGRVVAPAPGFEFVLMDIEELNRSMFAGELDVGKASFHAALLLSKSMLVLPSGSALGFGVGPLLLASQPESTPATFARQFPGKCATILCPGEHTTATLLARMFLRDLIDRGSVQLKQTVFSGIMPNLVAEMAEFGVCIHEGRFTWAEQGLHLVEDLGTRWESVTALPLPLGGILARRDLPPELLRSIQASIQDSVTWSLNHPGDALPIMREHAQEFDDEVLMKHVELYVNEWTVELGTVGRQALQALNVRAGESGIVAADNPDLTVFEP